MTFWVYKNTRSETWSVREKGHVTNHALNIILHNPTFKIWESVVTKIRLNKRKTPCAFICSDNIEICNSQTNIPKNAREVIFNPYKYKTFVYADNKKPVKNAKCCWMQFPKVYII